MPIVPNFCRKPLLFYGHFEDHRPPPTEPSIASPILVQILQTIARIKALGLLHRYIYLVFLYCARICRKESLPKKPPSPLLNSFLRRKLLTLLPKLRIVYQIGQGSRYLKLDPTCLNLVTTTSPIPSPIPNLCYPVLKS